MIATETRSRKIVSKTNQKRADRGRYRGRYRRRDACTQSELEVKQAEGNKRLYETTQLSSYRGPKRGSDKRIRGVTDVLRGSVLMTRCTNQWKRVKIQELNATKRREVEVEVG